MSLLQMLEKEKSDFQARVLKAQESGDSSTPCKFVDPNIFFVEPHPTHPTPRQLHDVELAKFACSLCPIQIACLYQAIGLGEVGVWGGTTTAERNAMLGKVAQGDLSEYVDPCMEAETSVS